MENIKDEDIIDENTIKKLIKDGYSLKLLSLEFDIPMNLLKQYSNEIKEGNKTEEKIKLEENEKRKEEEERLKLEQEKKEEEEKRKREEQEKRKEERIKLEQKKKEEEERIKLEQKKKEEEEKIKKEEQKKRTKESIKIKPETTLTVPSKMELLRQNYINLYYKTEKKVEKKETQTEEEREIVEKIIRKIEEIISEIEKADVIQTKQLCRILIEDINELNHYNISFEQLSKISKLIV